jgi:hypothetical protein
VVTAVQAAGVAVFAALQYATRPTAA